MKKIISLCMIAALLSSCGFYFRGLGNDKQYYAINHPINVTGKVNTQLTNDIIINAKNYGMQYSPDATITVNIDSINTSRSIISVLGGSSSYEYNVTMVTVFSATYNKKKLISKQKIVQSNEYVSNATAQLASSIAYNDVINYLQKATAERLVNQSVLALNNYYSNQDLDNT